VIQLTALLMECPEESWTPIAGFIQLSPFLLDGVAGRAKKFRTQEFHPKLILKYSFTKETSNKSLQKLFYPNFQQGEEVKYHKYYQWVCFVLFLQAAFFYIPRYLWKTSEGGKIRLLVQELQVNTSLSHLYFFVLRTQICRIGKVS